MDTDITTTRRPRARVIVHRRPTDAQVRAACELLHGACAIVAAVGSHGNTLEQLRAHVASALFGEVTRATTARMCAHAINLVCGAGACSVEEVA